MTDFASARHTLPIGDGRILPLRQRFGLADEWHLDFANTFEHLTFDFLPWFHQAVVVFGPAFRHSRFKAIRSIADTVGDNGPKQVLIEIFSMRWAEMLPISNQGLKGLQNLECSLETD